MNVVGYYPVDMVNGPGTRATLFVAGCEHKCKGCYNAVTWSPRAGSPYSRELEDRIIADLQDTDVCRQGLTLSGGDPLFPFNVPTIKRLVLRVREECPGKTIWMWTGYAFEDLTDDQQKIVSMIDVLVDGLFELDQRDKTLLWRGSHNQRILALTPAAQRELEGTGSAQQRKCATAPVYSRPHP